MYDDSSSIDVIDQEEANVSLDDQPHPPLLHRLMREFTLRVNNCPTKPTTEQFEPIRKLYGRLIRCLSPDQHQQLWESVTEAKRSGSHPELMVFVRFSKLRTYVFHQTSEYKAQQAEYDRTRKLDPKRQQQIREAKARHREKARKAVLQ